MGSIMKDKAKFKALMLVMAEKYDRAPSEDYGKMIWEMLADYDDGVCLKAFHHVFANGTYWNHFPSDLKAALSPKTPEWL